MLTNAKNMGGAIKSARQANLFNRVCSRVALARVRAGAKREPGRAKHQEDERGLKPRDYILDRSTTQFLERGVSGSSVFPLTTRLARSGCLKFRTPDIPPKPLANSIR